METLNNEKNALNLLLEGNSRFLSGKFLHDNQDYATRDKYKNAQNPFAIVVACADSRVPVEILFDAGIGDIFVIRSAGHSLSKSVLGSIEYAVTSTSAKLVLVLGHTNCAAVNVALKTYHKDDYNKLSDYMKSIISHIHTAFDDDCHICEKSNPEIIESYVRYQLKSINDDESLFSKLNKNGVVLKGGIYDIHTGEVKILD